MCQAIRQGPLWRRAKYVVLRERLQAWNHITFDLRQMVLRLLLKAWQSMLPGTWYVCARGATTIITRVGS